MKAEIKQLSALENRIGYQFKDKKLATRALTHSSYGDGRRTVLDNERLEFLGDRVLGLLTAEKLFESGAEQEGVLARRLNSLVRKETCARVAGDLDLGSVLLMSSSEIRQGGQTKTSILGDACEALIAAIYLDGGYAEAKLFYEKFWAHDLDKIADKSHIDPKTDLQEKVSGKLKTIPKYNVVERSGPDHRPEFIVEVEIEGVGSARGTGNSKKNAERAAAAELLKLWPEKKNG